MSCETCQHFKKYKPRKTRQEQYDEDTRPVAKGFWQKLKWLWNPSNFKQPLNDEIDFFLDAITREQNETGGTCHRFPKSTKVWTGHYCHEWSKRTVQ